MDISIPNDRKNTTNFVNCLFDDVMHNDKQAIEKVMLAIKKPAYEAIWSEYKKSPTIFVDKSAMADDIFQTGLLKIYQLMIFGFNGKVKQADDFFGFLIGIFKMTVLEYVPRDRKIDIEKGKSKLTFVESIQAREERLNQNEKSSNDHTLYELKDSNWDPLNILLDDEEKLLVQRKGEVADEVMMKTSIIPHEMISYCYSVVLPKALASIVCNSGEFVEILYVALENAISEDNSTIAAEIFLKTINRLSKELGIPYDITEMDLTFRTHSFLQGIIKETERHEKEKISKIRDIRDIVDKENGRKVKSLGKKKYQAKFAKRFMERDSIYTMSEKFASAYNKELDRHFEWGETYKENLKNGYHKYNYDIDSEGDLVYSDYFSKPFGEDTITSNRDYLGENIRKNAERADKQHEKEFKKRWHEVSNDEMRSTFLNIYSKNKMQELMGLER